MMVLADEDRNPEERQITKESANDLFHFAPQKEQFKCCFFATAALRQSGKVPERI